MQLIRPWADRERVGLGAVFAADKRPYHPPPFSSPLQATPFNLTVHWRLGLNLGDRYRILLQSDLARFPLIARLCKHGHIYPERGRGGAGGAVRSNTEALRRPLSPSTFFFPRKNALESFSEAPDRESATLFLFFGRNMQLLPSCSKAPLSGRPVP